MHLGIVLRMNASLEVCRLGSGRSTQRCRCSPTLAFWESLWANTPPSLKKGGEAEAAVKVSLSIGVLNRYFVRGMYGG